MSDHIGGIQINANIIVFEDINACDYYGDFFLLFEDLDIWTTEDGDSLEYSR
jgi:hypothetical protein